MGLLLAPVFEVVAFASVLVFGAAELDEIGLDGGRLGCCFLVGIVLGGPMLDVGATTGVEAIGAYTSG